ncbi:MAG: helix-turn-helix domain-containing protein [Rhizobiaceae bacterium]
MDIHPIRNEADYKTALDVLDSLWDAPDGTKEADILDVLAILVEDYENRRWPISRSTPIEILQFALTDMGRTQTELAQLLGSRSRASELLAGKRPLTLDMIRKINAAWGIPAALLISSVERGKAA